MATALNKSSNSNRPTHDSAAVCRLSSDCFPGQRVSPNVTQSTSTCDEHVTGLKLASETLTASLTRRSAPVKVLRGGSLELVEGELFYGRGATSAHLDCKFRRLPVKQTRACIRVL